MPATKTRPRRQTPRSAERGTVGIPAPAAVHQGYTPQPVTPEQVRLVAEHVRLVKQAKEMFEQADKVLDIILKTVGVGNVVKIGPKESAIVVDSFADQNTRWQSTAVRRYCVTVLKG